MKQQEFALTHVLPSGLQVEIKYDSTCHAVTGISNQVHEVIMRDDRGKKNITELFGELTPGDLPAWLTDAVDTDSIRRWRTVETEQSL